MIDESSTQDKSLFVYVNYDLDELLNDLPNSLMAGRLEFSKKIPDLKRYWYLPQRVIEYHAGDIVLTLTLERDGNGTAVGVGYINSDYYARDLANQIRRWNDGRQPGDQFGKQENPKIKAKGGAPSKEGYDWAYQKLIEGEPLETVYLQWKNKYPEDAARNIDPLEAFKAAMRRKKKKQAT